MPTVQNKLLLEEFGEVLEPLEQIGLSTRESVIYLCLLKYGAMTALALYRKTGIKRSTVYADLDLLKQKGLVIVQTKGARRLFAAEDPQRLEQVWESKRKIVDHIVPQLTSIFHNLDSGTNAIKHYYGVEGIKVVYDRILEELKPKDFYYVISDQQKWHNVAPDYFDDFVKRRAKKNLNIRLLLQDSKHARKAKAIERELNQKIKFLPVETLLNTNLVIVPHKVVMVQTMPPLVAMVIENSSIVQLNRTVFELLWEATA